MLRLARRVLSAHRSEVLYACAPLLCDDSVTLTVATVLLMGASLEPHEQQLYSVTYCSTFRATCAPVTLLVFK